MIVKAEAPAALLGRNLLCPICESENLHHGAITVFDPIGGYEDAGFCRLTDVSDSVNISTARNVSSGNPSHRRGGLVIVFTCESCDAAPQGAAYEFKLCIAQHKGTTEIWWRYA